MTGQIILLRCDGCNLPNEHFTVDGTDHLAPLIVGKYTDATEIARFIREGWTVTVHLHEEDS